MITNCSRTFKTDIRDFLIKTVSPGSFDILQAARVPFVYKVAHTFKNPIGAEIGVGFGVTAKEFLVQVNPKKLFLVDPYSKYTDEENGKKWVETRYLKGLEVAKTLALKPNVEFFRMPSKNFYRSLKDGCLDFCYIDANHTFESVIQDCEGFFSKVKVGGLLGGHDYDIAHPAVTKAVNEFVSNHKLTLEVSGNNWWVKIE